MCVTICFLIFGLTYTIFSIIQAIRTGNAYSKKDYFILAISLFIWIYYIWALYKALNRTKENTKELNPDAAKVKHILDMFKYLLVIFVLIMSFVMTS